ncbi:hypothetical protein PsorP6_011443 [Peronosclerospora sorghi]|uniref:Uncharacterized protein n=1 Tax=Peronosclerospora sorghi TaxID=230839 RepID=A0ACC0WMY1_9STRA|nr:hypothetical protein PsorP6_011443 [Peronosclerospora sorghi]
MPIGALFARIAAGFGCKVLAYDIKESPDALRFGAEYVSQGEVWARSDIISLHCPLLPSTKHVINAESIAKMKHGLIDTKASGLKRGKLGSVGLDAMEGPYFYSDRSGGIIADETLARLFTFPNVVITGHQAFFTQEALNNIGHTTIENFKAYRAKAELVNEVK